MSRVHSVALRMALATPLAAGALTIGRWLSLVEGDWLVRVTAFGPPMLGLLLGCGLVLLRLGLRWPWWIVAVSSVWLVGLDAYVVRSAGDGGVAPVSAWGLYGVYGLLVAIAWLTAPRSDSVV